MNESPLLSIVIANYNYGRFLETAIRSVVCQNMGNEVELIVCDAASSDNSVEVIRKFQKNISWWCSEEDGGQSAAFNKGFSHARGRFLTWLNADDVLLPKALMAFKKAVLIHPNCEWFGGGCIQMDPEMRVYKCDRARGISSRRAEYGLVTVTGPSSFFSRELYLRVGKIDERFQYMMDTDLWVKFATVGKAKYVPFASYVWGLRLHPGAKMSGHKFAPNGTILEGKASEVAYKRDKKRFTQLELESKWIHEGLPMGSRRMSRLSRFLTTSFAAAFLSRYDTWRLRGKKMVCVGDSK